MVRWDSANASRSQATVFRLSAERTEITLSFGRRRASSNGGQVEIDVSDRVVLSPETARRLAAMLRHAVRDYEWEHGSLGGEALPPAPPLSIRTAPVPLAGGIPEAATGLLQSLQGLGVQPVLERSFKLSERSLLANRFLWGFKRDSLTEDTGARLLELCERLQMPAAALTAFRQNIFKANILFFGCEESERAFRYKAYLEFGDRLVKARAEHRRDPLLLYVGFKWEAADNRRCSVARYTCHPGLSAPDMVERMRQAFYGQTSGTPFEVAREIVERSAGRVGDDRFLYLETTEDDNPRSSFDINLYNARLRLSDLEPLWLRTCEHYAIPAEQFLTVYAPVKAAPFGHVTGGVDRHGRDFLSVYFGAQ